MQKLSGSPIFHLSLVADNRRVLWAECQNGKGNYPELIEQFHYLTISPQDLPPFNPSLPSKSQKTLCSLYPNAALQIIRDSHRVTRKSSLLHIPSCGSQAHLVSILGTELNSSGSAACIQLHRLCTAQHEWAPFTL